MRLTGADIFAEVLVEQGVDTLFGYPNSVSTPCSTSTSAKISAPVSLIPCPPRIPQKYQKPLSPIRFIRDKG